MKGKRSEDPLDELSIDTIRTLAMDAVQEASSGHPGTAMAPVAYCLWQKYLRFDPEDPIWPNRDRFVLSIGHTSMLLYALLHLSGVRAVNPKYERLGSLSVPLDDIRRFRQLGSRCPGHPEYRWTSGVETTTGPLGQGVATSVGMAMGSRWMGEHFNRPGFEMFDYNVYAGDREDVAVPGRSYTFGAVKTAQARGDFQVLVERGRRALRVHLGADVAAGLRSLEAALREALGA